MRGSRRRRLTAVLAAVAVVAITAFVVLSTREAPAARYVFLICLDACRPDHLGCYGYQAGTSPNLDELARRGVVFDDAVAQAPWTIPSVGTIMSSTFPCQQGPRRPGGAGGTSAAPPGNFIETLRSLGFETALFTGGLTLKEKIPTSDLIGSTLRWFKQNRERRCAAVIHTYETHYPYVGTSACLGRLDPGYQGPFQSRFDDMSIIKRARIGRLAEAGLTDADLRRIRALYDCQIIRADQAVGDFVDSLEAWGALDQSVIIVFADHGEEFLEHGSIEHGQQLYEETLRVPLLLVAPSAVRGPRRVPGQVGLIDLAPTVMDLLGLDEPEGFEGRSLVPLFSRRHRAAAEPARPCGIPADCLVAEAVAHRTEMKVLRCPPWKLFFDPFFGATELYDLASDPGERNNLIDLRPEVASRLTDQLLTLEPYYPGGWFLAWRGDGPGGTRGVAALEGGLVEAVAHNFHPEVDTTTDLLRVSEDRSRVTFAARPGSGWQGVELRMEGPHGASISAERMSAGGRPEAGRTVAIGAGLARAALPVAVGPDQARVGRKDLREVFLRAEQTGVEMLVLWVEPGTDPTAKARKTAELKQQLKSIGYIE